MIKTIKKGLIGALLAATLGCSGIESKTEKIEPAKDIHIPAQRTLNYNDGGWTYGWDKLEETANVSYKIAQRYKAKK